MVSPQTPMGGVEVAERVPTPSELDAIWIDPEPEESKDRLGWANHSLTVVENPSFKGYLGILMAANTILNGNDDKAFLDYYLIRADKKYKIKKIDSGDTAKTSLRRGTNLYIPYGLGMVIGIQLQAKYLIEFIP